MSYITQAEIITRRLGENGRKRDEEIIAELIDEDVNSPEKKEMREGVLYFDGKNPAIMDREMHSYDANDGKRLEDDTDLVPNWKLMHPFMNLIITQESSYIAKNAITITCSDETAAGKEYVERLKMALGRKFNDIFIDLLEGASQRGMQAVKIRIGEDREDSSKEVFEYIPVDGDEVILIYDSRYGQRLMEVIRYYTVTENDEKLIYAEWWTETDVTFYEQQAGGEYKKIKTESHTEKVLERDGEDDIILEENGWGRTPWCILKNNKKCIPDHRYVKAMIDNYDFNTSDFANILEKPDSITSIAGFMGSDVAEASKNLKMFGIVLTESGNDGDGIQNITIEIQHEAKDAHLNRLNNDIYTFAMAVDPSDDDFKDPSGVTLKWMYGLLDTKAGRKIRKATDFLYNLFWFATKWINVKENKKYDSETLKITFNLAMMMNQTEIIDDLSKSTWLSPKSILENDPRVENVEVEEKRIAEQPRVEIPMGDGVDEE